MGGHLTFERGHLTIPKRAQRIARSLKFHIAPESHDAWKTILSFLLAQSSNFSEKSSPRYSGVKNLIHEILILIGFLRNETLRSKRVQYFILQHKRKPNQCDFLFHCSHLISTPFFTFFFIFACDCVTKSEPPPKIWLTTEMTPG